MKSRHKQTLKAYLFMAPALIILILFVFLPICGSIPLMFFDYSVLGKTKYIGFDNFVELLQDQEFRTALFNSILFVVIVPVIQILSVILALLVNRKMYGITLFRTLFYIPVVTSMVAVAIMWGFLFDSNGVVNTLLMEMGAISKPLGFLNNSKTAMLCIMFITVWQGLGYYMMLYLAGLQSVPKELEEAAWVDGASNFKTLFKIKIPMLKPYIWFCSLNSVISAVSVFDVVYVLTKGGPNDATNVINYYSYVKAFQDFEFGYAAAIGAVQAIITSILSIVVFVYGKRGGGMNGSE
ncbi:sugar ABC transporter permease [Cellulosilyticum sp. ST5]|uniref:carbohydrate ABC transporter permease n=1 Tax=unclassified Cellulosilyticum TaxID=2643091 RepID=UPI000F8C657C|nr:sugar ABC transporter permease [Cellulosilyticum sp. WCF-2]QEH70466.1 sugar ABC transporter permease [Cellulosilyticum sp. WCF-2]